MENEKKEMVFVPANFKEVPENAPETVRGKISYKVEDMIKFLQDNKDEKGWVNTKMMKSLKTGGIYFILDTYKPKPKEEVRDLSDTQRNPVNSKGTPMFDSELSEEELSSLNDIGF